MQSTEQKLREALQAISHIDDTTNHSVDASAALDRIGQIARQALATPTDDVRSILQDALNVLGCLEYGITGVDSWPCEDSVEDVVHRIRKVLEESQ